MQPATPGSGSIETTLRYEPKPDVGDLVIYKVPDGEVRPATITHVWSDDCVNLAVFTDGSHPQEFGGEARKHPVIQMTSVVRGTDEGEWEYPDDEEEEEVGEED